MRKSNLCKPRGGRVRAGDMEEEVAQHPANPALISVKRMRLDSQHESKHAPHDSEFYSSGSSESEEEEEDEVIHLKEALQHAVRVNAQKNHVQRRLDFNNLQVCEYNSIVTAPRVLRIEDYPHRPGKRIGARLEVVEMLASIASTCLTPGTRDFVVYALRLWDEDPGNQEFLLFAGMLSVADVVFKSLFKWKH